MSRYINPMDDKYFGIINKQIDESPLKNKMWDKFLTVYEEEVGAEKFDKELFEIYVNGNPGSEDNMVIIGAMMEKKPETGWIKAAFDIAAMSENSTTILKELMKLFNLQEDLYSQIERIKITLDVEKQNSEKRAALLENLKKDNIGLNEQLAKKLKSESYYKVQSDTYRNKTEELKKENLLLRNQIKELEVEYKKSLNAISEKAVGSEKASEMPDKLKDMQSSIEDSMNNVVQQIIENIDEYYKKIDIQFSKTENNILNAVNEISKTGSGNLFLMDMQEFDAPDSNTEHIEIIDEEMQNKQEMNGEMLGTVESETYDVPDVDAADFEYTEPPEFDGREYGYNESPENVENDDELQFSIQTPFESENAVQEENISNERKVSICKVDLNSGVTESSKKDMSEEQKAGMFQFFKFRVASEKKKREMLLNTLLKKHYPMEQIETVKKIMKEGKIDLNYVYEVVNKEDTTFDDLKRILIFTTTEATEEGDETE